MCGRFTLRTPAAQVAAAFQLELPLELPQRFNVAPTQDVAVVRLDPQSGRRRLDMLHWGLIPSWADDPGIGNRMINARAESAAEKPSFRRAFKSRRCLVVADGFFEWKKVGRRKQPYLITVDDRPFAFAGLWERWKGGDASNGPPLESCTIITTTANALMQSIHDRMPVILDPNDYDRWLSTSAEDSSQLQELLVPYPADAMQAVPVSTAVNNPRHDGPDCVEPVDADA